MKMVLFFSFAFKNVTGIQIAFDYMGVCSYMSEKVFMEWDS